ncbi:Density-regulated protein-like protein [Auxenochlorella protothecoides]|uniref:Density-regulated protein-like protein n=1 Tax=Auxenochlorella protothecoides TaxID=3075 RepID=A0A087SNS0_AUXPR|nr:Density-regulated protein-like protein [Auxenochlorella protothecoides]KFM27374.1 Density-regulated protein-like protein [Auxenochlorella protothecoides]
MGEGDGPSTSEVVPPRKVKYCQITGVPEEFNDFLPKDCDEYKKLKAAQQSAAESGLEELALQSLPAGPPAAKQLPGNKGKKKKGKPEVVLERNTRNKKKCVTTISGLDLFGVKLAEASKIFGKKFASGASIVKNAEGKEQIDIQGDFVDPAVDLILKQFKSIKKSDLALVENKKKAPYFDEEDSEDEDELFD